MPDDTTRRRAILLGGAAAVTALAGCSGDGSGGSDASTDTSTPTPTDTDTPSPTAAETSARTFTVRIENVAPTDFYGSDTATGGQIWITPGAYAVHTGENPIFTVGEPASIGLEALAEAGPPTGFETDPGLVDELAQVDRVSSVGAYTPKDTVADPNDPTGSAPGAPPIAPGGAFEITFDAGPDDRLSFASMYVPSNDVFLSPTPAIPLYDENDTPVEGDVTDNVALFDAGTELNGRPGVDPTGAPLQANNGGADAGATEGVVRPTEQISDPYTYADPMTALRVTLSPQ